MMEDPAPENIKGAKVATHTITHSIDWGLVAGAVVVIFVIWYLDPLNRLGRSSGAESDEGAGVR